MRINGFTYIKMNNYITFYVNPSWRRNSIMHTPILNPWWGNPLNESSLFTKQLFDTYAFNTECYTITDDINKANVVLVPYPHGWLVKNDVTFLKKCLLIAQKAGLPLLIDGSGDIEYPINGENVYVLRYGGYRFSLEKGGIQIPLFGDDLLERYRNGELSFRKKGREKPIVGFAGWANIALFQLVKIFIKELPIRLKSVFDIRYRACRKGVLYRRKAIKILHDSPLITLQAHIRNSFSGTSKTATGDMRKLQKQMVDTIMHSDYALDIRGDANNSARLFEILSLGRIPVIIDTERNFPFSDKIDYSSFSLIVDFRDMNHLPELIAKFHNSISPERFIEMQKNARDAYIRYFRIDAIMRSIVEELHKKISQQY